MLVGEQSPAPRVVAGLRKLHPQLTPAPVPTPADPSLRISGVLRQYYDNESWTLVRAAVSGGCLLAWRDGTIPRRAAARLPLRHLHLRPATTLLNGFKLSRLRDDTSVATFQACNATEYARWVHALCIEILRQTPLSQVPYLDVLSAADTVTRKPKNTQQESPSCPPKPPPRARRRLLTSPETLLTRRDHSPAATDEGIVVEDDDYDSSSDRSLDLSSSLDTLKNSDVFVAPIRRAEVIKCDNCSKLNAGTHLVHHTLPRAARSTEPEQGRHRYLKRWEGTAGGPERSRYNLEATRRKASALENRARSCSPNTHDVVTKYVPVRERRALFESLSQSGNSLARSTEQLTRPAAAHATPRRATSLHDLQAPPTRSVSDLRQFFEAVARSSGAGVPAACSLGAQRYSVPPAHLPRPYASLTCA